MSLLWDFRGKDLVHAEETVLAHDILQKDLFMGKIPRIVHLTYKHERFTGTRLACVESIREQTQGDFIVVLWTDEDIQDLIAERFARTYKEIYDWFAIKICKIDFIRLFFLYYYGGVYFDSDVRLLQRLDGSVPDLGADFYANHTNHHLLEAIQNSFMMSRKGDHFVKYHIDVIVETCTDIIEKKNSEYIYWHDPLLGGVAALLYVVDLTGPGALGHAIIRYPNYCRRNNVPKEEQSIIAGLDEDTFHNVEKQVVLEHDSPGSTWTNSEVITAAAGPLIAVIVVIFILFVFLLVITVHYSTKHHIRHQERQQRIKEETEKIEHRRRKRRS